jgi:hypothetical protein
VKEGELSPALQNALDKFTLDVTAKAKEGKIDPVFGRDTEIRQMVDILSRRRKNNPILVGEPGVAKPRWWKVWHSESPKAMYRNRSNLLFCARLTSACCRRARA